MVVTHTGRSSERFDLIITSAQLRLEVVPADQGGLFGLLCSPEILRKLEHFFKTKVVPKSLEKRSLR